MSSRSANGLPAALSDPGRALKSLGRIVSLVSSSGTGPRVRAALTTADGSDLQADDPDTPRSGGRPPALTG